MVESRTPLKCDRVKDSISLVESWTLLKGGRVKDSINLIESKTPIKYSRVNESIDEFDLIELKTLVEKTLNQNLREFLFGNF